MLKSVAVFGKGPLAIEACTLVIESPVLELEFVVACNPEPQWCDSLTEWATTNGTPCRSLEEFSSDLRINLDLAISCYYDNLFTVEQLRTMNLGINVHNSLLPRYQGKRPVERALENGDSFTGVTLHQMDAGMDTGAVFAQSRVDIESDMNLFDLYDQCVDRGIMLVRDFIQQYPDVHFVPQAASHTLSSA